jgi:lipopolysaccharide/colanic/teichoic acid biosynthesis glycosyltransferase
MGRPVKGALSDLSAVGIRHFVTPSGQLVCVGRPVDLLDQIHGRPQFTVPLEVARRDIKRGIDFTAALLALLVLAPLFLLVAALIKATSPGPVFFKQSRPGLRRRPFTMWKFRTMVPDAERQESQLRGEGGLFFKPKKDSRVTPLGRFLRKYSIDELPQFINVLKGEMSLVGPRPVLWHELERFQRTEQLRRFEMKPGLTCIWQVSGRSNTTDEARMRYDLEYVDGWSLSTDFKLLLKTVPVVVRGEGAV